MCENVYSAYKCVCIYLSVSVAVYRLHIQHQGRAGVKPKA